MITRFELIPLPENLKLYVRKIFVIESSGKLPSEDLKLIVPNACPKLVIPFKNNLVGISSNWKNITRENSISLIGVSDIPARVDFANEGEAGNITVEFSPAGAYRFFNFNWKEINNQIYDFGCIEPKRAAQLQQQLGDARATGQKIAIIQDFLVKCFAGDHQDTVFEYCVQKILNSKGTLSMKELERYTGYSARWLNMKFRERMGLSPKNFSSVVRFQQYYKALVTNTEQFFLQKEFYTFFHDQSHFIKDFKRFTGYSPHFLTQSSNDYDKVFYRK